MSSHKQPLPTLALAVKFPVITVALGGRIAPIAPSHIESRPVQPLVDSLGWVQSITPHLAIIARLSFKYTKLLGNPGIRIIITWAPTLFLSH